MILNKCLNAPKKLYGFKTGVWFVGGTLGILGLMLFGFWMGLGLGAVGAGMGNYIHDLIHNGKLQKIIYFHFSSDKFFSKTPNSSEKIFIST